MTQQALWRRLGTLCPAVALVAAAGLGGAARAQAPMPEDALQVTARHWVDGAVDSVRASAALPLRMEVSIGTLDSRLRLASCSRIEPYLPPGSRLWGRTRVGLRCLEGPVRWNVFLPVTVKAYGQAWVLRQDVPAGTALDESMVMQSEVDWAADPSPVLATPQQWAGQVALRALPTGQVLRQNVVRAPQVFQVGAQVRVVAQGAGFQITADGQALTAGVIGQQVKVRMDNGRVMTGQVLDANTVKLEI